MSLDLPVRALQDKAEKFSQPGQFLLALDGSSLTASSWLTPEIRAMAVSLGLNDAQLGADCSDLFIREVVYPTLGKMRAETLADMGMILDLPQFPFSDGSNANVLPKVEMHNQEVPFSVAAANMGIPLFAKGDGEGGVINHRVSHGGQYKNVWERLRDPETVSGLKTHFLTDGKSQVEINKAAMAVAMQSADALAAGITPMPEPDIKAITSLSAEKTAAAYTKYYETLMGALKLQFPDWEVSELGALMGTKLGPIENGEFTGGPADRVSEEALKKVATDTAKLISEIREKFGIGFFRMLTNGRPLDSMLKVVDGVNRKKNNDVPLGTSFSSAIISATLKKAKPNFDSRTRALSFDNKGLAQDFLGEAIEASHEASAGTMKPDKFPNVFSS